MGRDYTDANDNADWDASFVAPMSAEAPRALAGLRLDQALARMFPQYSRSRLQAWLVAGHITVDGARAPGSAVADEGDRL
ncbi:MAG: S4 domain-containing protein, partial [Phycisphaeraceae bacterium]